jgi:magnesium and cobalt transporter
VIHGEALAMIEGVFQVSELTVAEIMIPRTQMVSVDQSESPEQFIPKIYESGHSRFPVFDEEQEQVVGILLAKDLLKLLINNHLPQSFDFDEYLRPVMVVPESKRLDSLLQTFKADRQHMAIAVDEYGSVAGLVTIEDILEQIVGSIDDEYDMDEDEHYVIKQPNGSLIVKALMPLDEFNQEFDVQFETTDINTIGGYLLSCWHRMPKRNDSIQCGPLLFTVLHADYRRLHLLSVSHCAACID